MIGLNERQTPSEKSEDYPDVGLSLSMSSIQIFEAAKGTFFHFLNIHAHASYC